MKIKKIVYIFLGIIFWSVTAWSRPLELARLKGRGFGEDPRPGSLKTLVQFIETRSSLTVNPRTPLVAADGLDLFSHPFVIWSGVDEFPPLSEMEINRLRSFLTYGGFMFIDDAQASPGFGFDRSVRRELARMFPEEPLRDLVNDHTVYRSFFILKEASGRDQKKPKLEGITIQNRTVLMLSNNDLYGAFAKDGFGNWEYTVKSGEEGRVQSLRLAVNLLMYALCDDYKKDSLHVEYILKRRRLNP